ncbi:MAG: hypothetical protein MUC66_05925 [Methanolinea sp.]|jgi:hypothetical protein|nr:hypothetical protein [Methanolinea sp.]
MKMHPAFSWETASTVFIGGVCDPKISYAFYLREEMLPITTNFSCILVGELERKNPKSAAYRIRPEIHPVKIPRGYNDEKG